MEISLGERERKVSDFQIGRGNTKGFNGRKFVQTDYMLIDVKGRRMMVSLDADRAPQLKAIVSIADLLFS